MNNQGRILPSNLKLLTFADVNINLKTLNSTVSVLGCGWLGTPLAKHLVSLGCTVNGSTRTVAKVKQLADMGIKPFVIDIENLSGNIQEFLNTEILIINITSKTLAHYQRLLTHIQASTIKKLIFVSSTSVYPAENNVVTEDDVLDPSYSPLLPIENLFRSCKDITTTVVRFAGLFGYSRKPGNFFASGKLVPDPDGYVNMIHQDDCINILIEIIQQQAWGEIFNGCADSHPTKRDFYTKAALDIGAPLPNFKQEDKIVFKIVSNAKVKQQLKIEFTHNDLMNLLTS